ncbi:hypothetical protein AFR_06935 [Actinoplanes friuliensis DSM 7358]|uniref:Peptidase M48 domain-containing protein n=1 Tax=Actinoplanes friuliensis DSM 7358 TaxID=1246995 RepID=U5VVL9_9ACTN|nr:hypothetical protein AFR_06935 [Actinoplanes friuliensis DSM 7358]
MWALLDGAAQAAGTRAPDRVTVVADAAAKIIERTRLLGLIGGRRDLYLGLPLLQAWDEAHLRAVAAHELGHYSPRLGRLAPLAYRGRVAVARTVPRIPRRNPAGPLLRAYAKFYRRVDAPFSRAQELTADQIAAEYAGRSAAAAVLRDLPALDAVQRIFHAEYLGPGWQAGHVPDDIFGGFLRVLAARADDVAVLRARDPGTPSSWDTHPPVTDRLAALSLSTPPATPAPRPAPTGTAPAPGEPARPTDSGSEIADRPDVTNKSVDPTRAADGSSAASARGEDDRSTHGAGNPEPDLVSAAAPTGRPASLADAPTSTNPGGRDDAPNASASTTLTDATSTGRSDSSTASGSPQPSDAPGPAAFGNHGDAPTASGSSDHGDAPTATAFGDRGDASASAISEGRDGVSTAAASGGRGGAPAQRASTGSDEPSERVGRGEAPAGGAELGGRTSPEAGGPGAPAGDLVPDLPGLGRALQGVAFPPQGRTTVSWDVFFGAARTVEMQREAEAALVTISRAAGAPVGNAADVLDLASDGRLHKAAESVFTGLSAEETASRVAELVTLLLALAALHSDAARWRHSWTGTAELVAADGAHLDLGGLAALASDPATVGTARERLAELGIDPAAEPGADVARTRPEVVGGVVNLVVDGSRTDVLIVDTGLFLVPGLPRSQNGTAKRRLVQFAAADVPERDGAAPGSRFVPYAEVAGATRTKRRSWDLSLRNGGTMSVRAALDSDELPGGWAALDDAVAFLSRIR